MPEIILPKYRKERQGRIHHNLRVDRFWRHKATRMRVEVKRHLLVDNVRQQIIFYDPARKHEFSLSLQEMCEQYEPDGNLGDV